MERSKCIKCGKNSNGKEFCEMCQNQFNDLTTQLKLAFIHSHGHPKRATLWVHLDPPDVPWIKDGICTNNGESMCDIGYACDGCPYNKDIEGKEDIIIIGLEKIQKRAIEKVNNFMKENAEK